MSLSCPVMAGTILGTEILKTPSEEIEDVTLSIFRSSGRTYFRTKFLEIYPCSSCFSSCLPSITICRPIVFTVISSGENCWTSMQTWYFSLSDVTLDPLSISAANFDFHWLQQSSVMNGTMFTLKKSSMPIFRPKYWSKKLWVLLKHKGITDILYEEVKFDLGDHRDFSSLEALAGLWSFKFWCLNIYSARLRLASSETFGNFPQNSIQCNY